MAKDLSIPRRNKMFWHTVRDDPMFTTIRVISKHKDTQIYDTILPQHLTNQAMLESEAYKTYHVYATGEKIPKPKYVKNKADPESSRRRNLLKLLKAKLQQRWLKLLRRSNLQQHKGTNVIPGVLDVPTYNSDDEQISWKSSNEEDDDEVSMSKNDDDNDDDYQNDDNADNECDDQDGDNEQTESDNDDDGFVHPKLSTFDDKERQDEEDKEEEWSDDEVNDEVAQGGNDQNENMDEEDTNEDEQVNELYRDANINLEGRDTDMADANVQATQVIEDTHVIITAVTPEFEDKVKSLEDNFSEFKQTNPFAKVVLLIPGIVDTYLANKMNEAVKAVVQLQSDRLREEAQADNEDFINKIDEHIKKIIKEQVKTCHAIAANLSELELKKILIDKIENNKSIHRSVQEEALYKVLVDAYETDKDILETYGDIVTFKRRRDDKDEDKEPFAGSNRGNLAQKEDPRKSFNELMDTPLDFSAFVLNWLKVDTLTLKLLVGLTFELMKGSCKSLVELEYFLEEVYKATTDQLDWNNPEGQQYPHDLCKPLPLIPNSRGKLTNLNVEERIALGVSLRMFTRSIILKRRVEDLPLGVESYQKKLNLTRPNTYRLDLKQKSAYTAYSNPRGFIYQNKDKKHRLMHIDELYKFSDGTLNDVRSVLNDILKRIRMKYLP
ncbi:hypothetical protein Tco_0731145 [Tanacetum coccineum]